MELVIMAAGMGSRFGGLKQIQPVGPNGEFIIDYSIYDAKRAGFDKVVFIIKKEMLNDFEETIGKRLKDQIEISYAFQDMADVPEGVNIPEDRVKPLGTAHALYCARNVVKGDFAVITADDFYGHESFLDLADSLKNTNDYSVMGYKIGNTISDNGSVKRGVCFTEGDKLVRITESKVEKIDGVITGSPLNGSASYTMEPDHPVSMLYYGLRHDIFDFINNDIVEFFKNQTDLSTIEYYLPDVLDKLMKNGIDIKLINTKAVWKGVTYATDLEELQAYINKLIEQGVYPNNLWG